MRHVGCDCRDCDDRLSLATLAMLGLWIVTAVGGYIAAINWLRSAF